MSSESLVKCDACGNRIHYPKEKVATLVVPLPKKAAEEPTFHPMMMMFGESPRTHEFHMCMGCAYGIVGALANSELKREILSMASDRGPEAYANAGDFIKVKVPRRFKKGAEG